MSGKNGFLMLNFTCICLTVALFLAAAPGFAQDYKVHRYEGLTDLPTSEVHGITQDNWGRMWFAHRHGISSYDGASWKHYMDLKQSRVNSFSRIAADRSGRIWALPLSRQGMINLVFFDGSEWKTISPMNNTALSLAESTCMALMDQSGSPGDFPVIAIGTREHGVFLWNRDNWENLEESRGLLHNSVTGFAVLNGKFYVATKGGVSVIDPTQPGYAVIDNSLSKQSDVFASGIYGITVEDHRRYPDSSLSTSRIWLLTKTCIGYLEENSNTPVRTSPAILFNDDGEFHRMAPDYRSGLYIGQVGWISYYNYNTGSWNLIGTANGLVSGGMNDVFTDFEKNTWIAANRGLSKIASRRFGNFYKRDGMMDNEVTAVLEYRPGKFLLGHNKGLSFTETGKDFSRFRAVLLEKYIGGSTLLTRVMNLKTDRQGNIWAALDGTGLLKINKQNRYTWYNTSHGLPPTVSSIWPGSIGVLWVGTPTGLYRYDNNRFLRIPAPGPNKLSIRNLYGISTDSGLQLYLCTSNTGLVMYRPSDGLWEHYRVDGLNRINSVYSAFKDSKGQFWVGALSGLATIDEKTETLVPFKTGNLDIRIPIYFILEDFKNRIWFGTSEGVIRWDGNTMRKYSVQEGLSGQETNRGAGYVDSTGKLWVGTARGLSIYNEAFDHSEAWNPPPKMRIMSIKTDIQEFDLTQTVPDMKLDSGTQFMAFHFIAPSFYDEKAVRFQYRLEGHENEWIHLLSSYERTIRYSNLAPGNYRFHIKAGNTLDAWSDTVSSPLFTIPAPFYTRWWFFIILFLAGLLIFFSIFRYSTQQTYARRLEQQVKERTEQLRSMEQDYRNLFEESKDAVFMTHPDGSVIDINPAGIEMFGLSSKEELIRLSRLTRLVYKDPNQQAAFVKALSQHGYVKDFELVFRKKDGSHLNLQLTAGVVRDKQGNIIAHRGIARDITEKKQLEQQLVQAQKMEAIGTLAGGIAHDFNNILGVIMGYSELVLDDTLHDPLVNQNTRHILTAAKRASELVKQILAFSRQSKRKRKPLNLEAIIKEALKLLRSSLPATIEIRRHISLETGSVLADPTQIHQVMMNLCTNAAHAMKVEGGVLEVRLDEVQLDEEAVKKYHEIPPGTYLRLSVSDTGHGIPKIVMKRIFDPYFTTKDTGEGTGLGLAVIHGIVKSHDGDISVFSEPGKGTTFHVLLPVIREAPEQETQSATPAQTPTGSEHILFVDDETSLLQAGKQALERLGYQVTGITDPIEALETFRKTPEDFDLLITDFTMPGMTGLKLAEKVKGIDPGVPVILCSGFSTNIPEETIRDLTNAFVMKPVITSDLARVIRKVLD